MDMSSDEDLEFENVRAKLLPGNKEPSQKLHENMGRIVLPLSDNENSKLYHDNENAEQGITSDDGSTFINSEHGDENALTINSETKTKGIWHWIPKRFIVLSLAFFGNFNMYCVRMCLSVTIVAMSTDDMGSDRSNGTVLHTANEPEFQWGKEFQGTILASLYWGYTATQIPAGLLTFKYGGTFLFGFSIFGSSVLTLATPFIVRQSVYAFIVLRIIEGLLLGMVAAAGQTIVSKWSPIYERSIFTTFGYSGLLFGTVVANSVSGMLAASSWGWPSVFYFFGSLGIVWYVFWLYFVYEEPQDHPNISEKELKKIGKHWHTKLSCRLIPWKNILTSMPVWCLIISAFADCWGFYTFMLSFPSYLKDVLKFDITKIGFVSSLPYVICAILAPVWGLFIDMLRRKKYISTIFSRKLSAALGMGVSSIFIVVITYTNTPLAAMTMVIIAISLTSITASGPSANLVEIAPKYAGVLMGIVNFACNITGFICPVVVGAITKQGDPAKQWAIIFYIIAGIELCGMSIYLCFASSEKQPWSEY